MRTMFDSTSFKDIPLQGCDLIMGYVTDNRVTSGTWSEADWKAAEATGKKLVRICIYNDRYDADVIDCEAGDNDARGVVPWIREKWLRGETPTVYCYSDLGPFGYRITDVRLECEAVGLKHPLFLLTKFDNDPTLPDDPEVIGKQYENSALTGGHFDVSVVRDRWPGVDKEDAVSAPVYAGQSVTDVNIKVGEVAQIAGTWTYPGKGNRTIVNKVYGTTPGIFPVTMYPPADPDADPTLVVNTQPAYFVVAVRTA